MPGHKVFITNELLEDYRVMGFLTANGTRIEPIRLKEEVKELPIKEDQNSWRTINT